MKKIRLTDPRNIDQQFRQNGCIMMFDEVEISELTSRGDIDPDSMHKSLFELAVKENVIRQE